MNYVLKIENGKRVLEVSGELKTSEAPSFQTELLNRLAEDARLIVDFAGVNYICSAGLRALLAGQQLVDQSDDGEMVLRRVDEEVMSVLMSTGFVNVLTIR